MIQYKRGEDPPPPNLENVISSDLSEGEIEMASKYKERVKLGINSNGAPIFGWAVGDTKEELHQSIASLLSASNMNLAKTKRDNAPEWSEYAQTWFDIFHAPNLAPKTLVKDKSLFKNHIKPAFTGKKINVITTAEVQNYLQTKAQYCHSQVRDIMWMLRKIFSSAIEDEYIVRNPMDSDRISNPSQKETNERVPLTSQEQADIINNLPKIKGDIDRLFVAFLMFTCLRPCEILGLCWKDIDVQRRMIKVQRDLVFVNGKPVVGDTKTEESQREIPIDPRLYEYLGPMMNDGFIFGNGGKCITSESVFRKMWRDVKKTIDMHGMTPYVGRHTFATNMSRAGVPIKTAMAMMGHKDERMLLRTYTHVDNNDLLKANETMSAYILSLKSKNSDEKMNHVT